MYIIIFIFCFAYQFVLSLAQPYSGYIPINQQTGSNIFYWLFPAKNSKYPEEKTPLIAWFQGGPGASSLLGLFHEIGPFTLDTSSDPPTMIERKVGSWNEHYHLIFIDQPVGTGFSFVQDKSGYATNTHDAAADMYIFFGNLMQQYPLLMKCPLFIAGESFAGHWIPAIASYFLQKGNVPLQGIMIGDGLIDPASQILSKPDVALTFGLINMKQRDELYEIASKASEAALNERYDEAISRRYTLENKIHQYSQGVNLYDIRIYGKYDWTPLETFLQQQSVKEWLHIGNSPKEFGVHSHPVHRRMKHEMMKSLKHLFPEILARIPVLLYQGQFDYKDGFYSTQRWIDDINWSGAQGFHDAERVLWNRKDGEPAGYIRQFENLREVLILGAGHLVPMDQPAASAEMMEDFVSSCMMNIGSNPTILAQPHTPHLARKNHTWHVFEL